MVLPRSSISESRGARHSCHVNQMSFTFPRNADGVWSTAWWAPVPATQEVSVTEGGAVSSAGISGVTMVQLSVRTALDGVPGRTSFSVGGRHGAINRMSVGDSQTFTVRLPFAK